MDKTFHEFELKDIFQTNHFSRGLQVPTGASISSSTLEKGSTPRISVTSMNNGIVGYYKDVDSKNYRTYENCISVSFLGTVFYHPYRASFDMKVHCLKPIDRELRSGEALYLVACIQKLVKNNTYGNQTSSTDLPYMKIHLPVDKDGEPDWNYMQKRIEELEKERIEELEKERIEELEKERIEELEKYLLATGLNDYQLTDEDIDVLSLALVSGIKKNQTCENVVKICGEFKISNLFNVDKWVYGKNKDWTSRYDEHRKGRIPVISGITKNNGIIYYTEDEYDDTEIQQPGLTISTRGEYSGTVFYHDEPFLLSNNVLTMPILNKTEKQQLFLATLIMKLGYGGYNNYPTKGQLESDYISLPIKQDQNNNPLIDPERKYHPDGYIPDWDFMEKYIRAIEKVVIADVVKYKDEIIAKTKTIIK